MKHYVHFSKQAITQILLNGFEAFIIKHGKKNRSGLEMHASLYGWHEETNSTLHYHIEFLSVDTSADMNSGYVASNPETQLLKEHIAQAVGFSCVGALHTHPYLLHEEGDLAWVRKKGCQFSEEDLVCFRGKLRELTAIDPATKALEVVLTIKKIERQNFQLDGYLDEQENVFEFTVGNCKCFLRAQVFSLDQQNNLIQEPTKLKCDFLQNFKQISADFGRVKVAPGKKQIVEYKT